MNLFIVAGCRDLGLLSAEHPAGADFGVEMHIDLVLKDRSLVSRQMPQQPLNPPDFAIPNSPDRQSALKEVFVRDRADRRFDSIGRPGLC